MGLKLDSLNNNIPNNSSGGVPLVSGGFEGYVPVTPPDADVAGVSSVTPVIPYPPMPPTPPPPPYPVSGERNN